MSSVGFIFLLIGIFKKDSRFKWAALVCVGFDFFAIFLSIGIGALMPFMAH